MKRSWNGLTPAEFKEYMELTMKMRETDKRLTGDISTGYKYEPETVKPVTIIKVIFNEPATIVFWSDGIKTVVKAHEDDVFDPEKGLAMAICKRAYGNTGSYFNEFKKWTKDYKPKDYNIPFVPTLEIGINVKRFKEDLDRVVDALASRRNRADC